jgi:hypothetical protein
MICEKVPYDTHREAMKASTTHRNPGRHKYSAYKCDECGKFHLTTVTKNLRPVKEKYKFRYDPTKFIDVIMPKLNKKKRK